MKTILLLTTLTLFLTSCSRSLSPEQYLKYFEAHKSKFYKKITRNEVTATICYIPNEVYAAREMMVDTTRKAKETLGKYNNSLFFAIGIYSEKYGKFSVMNLQGGLQKRSENIYKNSFDRSNDIFILSGKDTVKTEDYYFERNWNTGNEDMLLIAFKKKNIQKNKKSHLIVRNMVSELGTIDIRIDKLITNTLKLRG